VGSLWGKTRDRPPRYVCADVERFREEPFGVEERVKATAQRDGHRVRIRFEQEPGSSGKFTVHYLVRQLAGYDVAGKPSTGNKVLRSDPLASQAAAGNVDLVRGPWNEAFLSEFERFNGDPKVHDDIVDTGSGAFEDLTRGGGEVMVR
jgi:predicted phage terminase large subunit-like protein